MSTTADGKINQSILGSWELSLHDKSPGTRRLYLRVVRQFEGWLAATGRPGGGVGDLLEVTRQDAEAWFGSMRQAGLAAATIRSRWIALRNLYGWEQVGPDWKIVEAVNVAH